jgi:hypothetical protein
MQNLSLKLLEQHSDLQDPVVVGALALAGGAEVDA